MSGNIQHLVGTFILGQLWLRASVLWDSLSAGEGMDVLSGS